MHEGDTGESGKLRFGRERATRCRLVKRLVAGLQLASWLVGCVTGVVVAGGMPDLD